MVSAQKKQSKMFPTKNESVKVISRLYGTATSQKRLEKFYALIFHKTLFQPFQASFGPEILIQF